MKGTLAVLLGLTAALSASGASARGGAGDPHDALDATGTPTDRYLGPDEIRDALHSATDAFFGCYREHVRGARDAGQVAITFTIERGGRVGAAAAELDGAPPALGPCLEAVVGALRFSTHDGDPVDVSYPLVHQVDRSGARILPYPVVFTRPRPVRLPLLVLPADATAGELSLLERVLIRDEAAFPEHTPADPAPPTPGAPLEPSPAPSDARPAP